MGLLGRIFFAVAAVAVVGAALAHAQGVPPDGPTSVVTMAPQQAGNPWDAVGSVSWPTAAYLVVTRFLTVLERMVTDTRAWLDRVLDVTKGKLSINYKKTVVSTWAENDPDRTGPIPVQHNRRSTDRDRNGGSTEPFDESDH